MSEKFIPTFFAEPGPATERLINFYPSFDIPVILLSGIFLLSLRHFLTRNVINPYGKSKGLSGIKLLRFAENAWFSLYYIVQMTFGLYVLWNSSWLWEWRKTYLEYPLEDQQDFDRPELYGLRFYYLVAMGFYSQALYGLLFIDERMKDFTEMVLHHVLTISLILFSITTSYHRCGSIIILLHDAVDIFLYNAKMAHELGKETAANVLFLLFTASFFVLRLICLPFMVINVYWCLDDPRLVANFKSAHFVFKTVTDAATPFDVSSYGICVNQYCISTLWFVLGALALLICLHVFWFSIVLRLLFKTVLGNKIHDPRIEGNNYVKEEAKQNAIKSEAISKKEDVLKQRKQELNVHMNDTVSGTA